MLPLKVNDDLTIALFKKAHADLLLDVVIRNREHLDQWMHWSHAIRTVEDVYAFFERSQKRYDDNNGFHAGMWYQGQLAGGFAVRDIDRGDHKAEIGYWLDQAFVGKGLVTQACVGVINMLFEREKLHRIEIQCATGNKRSRAVPERLGFSLEGILREAYWIGDRYHDNALYSLLDREWAASPFATTAR